MDDTSVINFLLSTEIIPLCLRTMDMGSELSKTVATFIVQKILIDPVSPFLQFEAAIPCKAAASYLLVFIVHQSISASRATPHRKHGKKLPSSNCQEAGQCASHDMCACSCFVIICIWFLSTSKLSWSAGRSRICLCHGGEVLCCQWSATDHADILAGVVQRTAG